MIHLTAMTLLQSVKECRFYLPEFKERSKFKSLVKAETEENQAI